MQKLSKARKVLLTAFVCVFMFALSAFVFSACGKSGDGYTVTFIVDGSTYASKETSDGSVEQPADPSKDYYTFRGWYEDEDYTTEFVNSGISGDMTVYARFTAITVTLYVDNAVVESDIVLANLADYTSKYEQAADKEELTFDGWYIDAGCATAYTGTQDITTGLYGRNVVALSYDNGYKTVYTALITVGGTASQPDASDIAQWYMDENELYYVDENGNDIDFTKTTYNANATITVLWQTPGLSVSQISGTDYLEVKVKGSDYASNGTSYPVLSFLGKTSQGTISTVTFNQGAYTNAINVEKVIFNSGIQYISNFNMPSGSNCTEVVLPDTLKILEKSFNQFGALASIELPDSLEVIIDCFWADYFNTDVESSRQRTEEYSFDIEIPAGVKTMVLVPNNLTFASGSSFYKDNDTGAVYQASDDGNKTLVSYYTIKNGTLDLTVLTFDAIQAGIFYGYSFDTVKFPSTFGYIEYSVDVNDYPYYTGSLLFNGDYTDDESIKGSGMDVRVFTVISNAEELEYVIFDTVVYPKALSIYAVTGSSVNPYSEYSNVIFTGEQKNGESITVYLTVTNTMSEISYSYTSAEYKSGDTLTKENLYTLAGITCTETTDGDDTYYSYYDKDGYGVNIDSITVLGAAFAEGEVNSNCYIVLECSYSSLGIYYSLNDGETGYIVTGFDVDNAQKLEDGTYMVIIPEYIGGGLPVVEIAESAFANVNTVSKIYIGANVQIIHSYAFAYMKYLEYVEISAGSLSVIESYAFYQAGAKETSSGSGEYEKNVSLTITLPLSSLTEVQPYAFKSPAITGFIPVSGEESRNVYDIVADDDDDIAGYAGKYVFAGYYSGYYIEILKYISSEEGGTTQNTTISSSTIYNLTKYNVQLIAVAGGQTASVMLYLGQWGTNTQMVTAVSDEHKIYLCYEIMEGSVYYLSNVTTLKFVSVSYVHKNAFTDMSRVNAIKYYYLSQDATSPVMRMTFTEFDYTKLTSLSSELFEDGFWNGILSSGDDYSTVSDLFGGAEHGDNANNYTNKK